MPVGHLLRPFLFVLSPSDEENVGRVRYLLAGLELGRFQVQILHEYDTCCFSAHGRHDKMLKYEAEIRAELMADDRADGQHGWFTETADNHSKHEVCAQDKTLITAALKGKFPPKSPSWEKLPCDIMHQPLPANCEQNVEPGLAPGYEPHIPDDPEPQTEDGFSLLGYGACRDKDQTYPPWGSGSGTNQQCADKCRASDGCVAYMSTQNEAPGQQGSCQFYCGSKGSLCTEPGTGGGNLTTTDGSQQGSLLRFCWLKAVGASTRHGARRLRDRQRARRQRALGPWINPEVGGGQ